MNRVMTNYVFDPIAKTVKLNDVGSLNQGDVSLITNVTRGAIIYQFNSATKGGAIAYNVITLDFDTSSMSASDELRIDYHDEEEPVYFRKLSEFTDTVGIKHKTVVIDSLPDILANGDYVLPITDVAGYTTATFEISGTFTANLTCYDGVTGNDMQVVPLSFGTTEDITTIISGAGLFTARLKAPKLALRVTSYTSGTPKLTLHLSSSPYTSRTVSTVSTSLSTIDTARALSGAAVTTTTGVDSRSKRQLFYMLSVTGTGGTTPQLVVSVEASVDGNTPWYPVNHSTGLPVNISITANGDYSLGVTEPFGRFVRLKYTVTGTSPTFTVTSKLIAKD